SMPRRERRAKHSDDASSGASAADYSSSDNLVLALDEAAGVLPCADVPQHDVARYTAKERNPCTNEHRNASDHKALDQPVLQKALNRDPAIHVNVLDAASRKLRQDFGRSPGHTLHGSPARGGRERAGAEHDNGLPAIRPLLKGQDRFESLAPDDQGINRRNELIVAVGFATAGRQEVEVTIRSCDEAVEAGANEDRRFHVPAPAAASLPGNITSGAPLSTGAIDVLEQSFKR